MVYAATIVGVSALAQWNAHFPTSTTQTLWRSFSIVSATIPILSASVVQFEFDGGWAKMCHRIVAFTLLVLHVLNRVVLIVLVFYSFHSLPSDVYATATWLDFFPFFH